MLLSSYAAAGDGFLSPPLNTALLCKVRTVRSTTIGEVEREKRTERIAKSDQCVAGRLAVGSVAELRWCVGDRVSESVICVL